MTVMACITGLILGAAEPPAAPKQPAGTNASAFALKPSLPYDVDIAALQRLSIKPFKNNPPFTIPPENIAYAQRLFDVFSWQVFLALNWPALPDGRPDARKSPADAGTPRVWQHYCQAGQVFRDDGEPPLPWPSKAAVPMLDESVQAFTAPMVDQQGRWVRYQVVLNRIEYDYLVGNQLYNLDGQVRFTTTNKVDFPANQGMRRHGAMELKFAWKQLSEQDDRRRFLVRQAEVVTLDGSKTNGEFALVGMHIAVRTESAPTWVWATFEHVDNTAVNDLEKDSHGRPLRPTFFNPDNPAKPVNVQPAKNSVPVRQFNPKTGKADGPEVFTTWDEAKTTDPTQTIMVLPVPKATAALNREVQAVLAGIGSVFQYYELIGTQWPADPPYPAFPNGVAAQADGRLLPASPESILFKVPGKVVPVHLVNTTMETFFQNGNQPAGPVAEDDRLPPGLLADPNTIFATESCAGCHFSAGAAIAFKRDMNLRTVVTQTVTVSGGKTNTAYYPIAVFGKNAVRGMNGNADYSWILQMRAKARPIDSPELGTNFAATGSSKNYVLLDNSGLLVLNRQTICPVK